MQMQANTGYCQESARKPPPAGAGEINFLLKRVNEEVGFGTPPEAGAEAFVAEAKSILARG